MHVLFYNVARIHKTLTPAMAAGISDHVWSLEEICDIGVTDCICGCNQDPSQRCSANPISNHILTIQE
jgi:hypothetical protein